MECGVNGALNPATISVDIPLSNLRDRPLSLVSQVRSICDQTKTHIYAFETCSSGNSVKYSIYGKWRDCYSAARLLWYRLTKRVTIHVHDSWSLALSQQQADVGGRTLACLYPVEISRLKSANIMLLKGTYWEVVKLRRELVLRQRKKVMRMEAGGLLVAAYASNSAETVAQGLQATEILAAIQADLRENLRDNCDLNGGIGLSSLDLLQLLFGITAQSQPHSLLMDPESQATDLLNQSFESCVSPSSSSIDEHREHIGHELLFGVDELDTN